MGPPVLRSGRVARGAAKWVQKLMRKLINSLRCVLSSSFSSEDTFKPSHDFSKFEKSSTFQRLFFPKRSGSLFHVAFHIVLLLLAVISYMLSLEPCPYDRNSRCLDWLFIDKMFHKLALSIAISALIYAYFVISIFLRKTVSKLFGLLLVLPSLIFVFSMGHKTSWQEHGGISRFIVISFAFIAIILLLALKSFLKLSSYVSKVSGVRKLQLRLIFVVLVLLYFVVELRHRQNLGRRNFYASPNHELSMNHSDQENKFCKFYPPKYFLLDLLSDFLKVSALSSCAFSKSLDWLPLSLESSSIIGFPLTNNLSSNLLSEMPDLWKYTEKHLRNCSEMSQCPELETFIHRNGPRHDPTMSVRVARNNTLVQERLGRIRRINNTATEPPNILILFIDALSRPGFARTMPESFKLLKKWDRDGKTRVTPFFRFATFAAYTEPNMFPFTFGIRRITAESVSKRIADHPRPESYFERTANVGYVTGYVATACQAEDFEWKPYLPLNIEHHDHRLMFCDPNFIDVEDPWNPTKGPYSAFKRCLYGKHVHEYAFDYTRSFWSAYPELPKIMKLHLSEAHESSAEHVRYMDEHMMKLLQDFEHKGYLNNTVIIIMSDHGNHMHAILRLFQGHSWSSFETHEPLLVFATPPNMGAKKALDHNAQQLITMYDVRHTILSLAGADTSSPFPGPPHNNLMHTKLSFNRTCTLLGVGQGVCRC